MRLTRKPQTQFQTNSREVEALGDSASKIWNVAFQTNSREVEAASTVATHRQSVGVSDELS